MGEPIDTHFDKRETSQGRHARMATGASSWSVRRRSLVAAIAAAMAALMIVGVLAAHGRAGASGDGDQSAAQEALEAQTLETAYAADDSRKRSRSSRFTTSKPRKLLVPACVRTTPTVSPETAAMHWAR